MRAASGNASLVKRALTIVWLERSRALLRHAFLPVGLYARHLGPLGVSIPHEGGTYQRYMGDTSVPGKGEILVWQPAAS